MLFVEAPVCLDGSLFLFDVQSSMHNRNAIYKTFEKRFNEVEALHRSLRLERVKALGITGSWNEFHPLLTIDPEFQMSMYYMKGMEYAKALLINIVHGKDKIVVQETEKG